MESLYILYHILPTDISSSFSSYYPSIPSLSSLSDEGMNCYELLSPTNKEVLLIDILTAWATWLSDIGVNYNFYARCLLSGNKLIHLQSPASCVPVLDGLIYLYLQPSGAMPFAPLEQSIAYFEKSQREIYGSSTMVEGGTSAGAIKKKVESKWFICSIILTTFRSPSR